MPQDRADQVTDQQAGEAVIDELRVFIEDVRAWLEAVPIRLDPMLSVIAAMQGTVQSAQLDLVRPVSGGTAESAQVDVAAAALNDHAGTLAATAEHAAEAVRERGDRIDAMLAEIRRIRAETVPA